MEEQQIKDEEEKVKKLAEFLKTTAIQNLIKNFAKNEQLPTNSQTLSEFFH